jgi:hypothetical protein
MGSQAACRRFIATIFREISKQRVHGAIIGRVHERPALALLLDKTCMHEAVEMERECGWRHVEALGDESGRQPVGAALYEEPEDPEASRVCESPKGIESLLGLHRVRTSTPPCARWQASI